ncbi:MAG TPA: PKD domain-containing protein [Methanoregulaceae archaeon]|nr:PKD domain-containing protein [Methanoregulaceae archaeon]
MKKICGQLLFLFLFCSCLGMLSCCGVANAYSISIESVHPTDSNYSHTWNITNPSATAIRVHFTKIDLGTDPKQYQSGDTLVLKDQNGNIVHTYQGGDNYGANQDVLPDGGWSDWCVGNDITLTLTTKSGNTYGFTVDQMEIRETVAPINDLPESFHTTAAFYSHTWNITNPSATAIRVHFTKIDLGTDPKQYQSGDTLVLKDQNGNIVHTYQGGDNYGANQDVLPDGGWSDWCVGNDITLTLTTKSGNTYGFTVDQIDPPLLSQAPVANFVAVQTSDATQLLVQFTDQSTGTAPLTYDWNFGDGATSTAASPSHTYASVGIYTVTLKVTNTDGENTAIQDVPVNTIPIPPPHTYEGVYVPGGITWEDANADAIAKGGHLAVITSKEENELVFTTAASDDRLWINNNDGRIHGPWLGGYQTDGTQDPASGWMWVTGEAWNYANWETGEPNDQAGQSENRLLYFSLGNSKDLTWNDGEKSSKLNGYILERGDFNSLSINSNPQGASIWVDGSDTGKVTPATIGVTEGSHVIKIKMNGYCEYNSNLITVTGGNTISLSPILKKGLQVPYIHQVFDTPDNFDRTGACAATSATMIDAFYKKITPDPNEIKTGYLHKSQYGNYVPDLDGIIWPDPNDENNMCYVCFLDHLKWAGDFDVKLNEGLTQDKAEKIVRTEIDNGRPLIARTLIYSSAGHYCVIVGYEIDSNNQLYYLVNDPFGNIENQGKITEQPVRYSYQQMKIDGNLLTSRGLITITPSHSYEGVYVPGGITWEVANADANARGGHLAVITSKEENELVFTTAASDDRLWINNNDGRIHGPWLGGYQTDGTQDPASGWMWVTGEAWNYANWETGEPNDQAGQSENRLVYFSLGNLKDLTWNDEEESLKLNGYILEREDFSSLPINSTGFDIDKNGYGKDIGNPRIPEISKELFKTTFNRDSSWWNDLWTDKIYEDEKDIAAKGSCFGVSASSSRIFQNGSEPELQLYFPKLDKKLPDEFSQPPYLNKNQGYTYEDFISYYHLLQKSEGFVKASANYDKYDYTKSFAFFKSSISNWKDDPIILTFTMPIYSDDPTNKLFNFYSHAAVPLGYYQENSDYGYIFTYDSNFPKESLIRFDLKNNKAYAVDYIGRKPTETTYLKGDIASINLIKLSQLNNKYNNLVDRLQNPLGNAFNAHILYTDSEGRHLGYYNGTLLDEIAGTSPIYTANDLPTSLESYYVGDIPVNRQLIGINDGPSKLTILRDDILYQITMNIQNNSVTEINTIDDKSTLIINPSRDVYSVNLTILRESPPAEYFINLNDFNIEKNTSFKIEFNETDLNLSILNSGPNKLANLRLETNITNCQSIELKDIIIRQNSTTIIKLKNDESQPPICISNLHNTTNLPDSITWAWTDPSSSDLDHVMIYLNGTFQSNVTKGTQAYSASGLTPNTAYTIGTRTVGATGLVNSTWVNQTATTAPDSDPGISPPEALFTSNITSGNAPLTVQFNDSSSGTVTSYAWDFGDGANSTEQNPVHTYTNYSIYNVSLSVTNAAGEDTITKNDYIQVIPMVGGDTGYYLIHCNVEGAEVYFDQDSKGVITDGTLLVKIYLTATPYHRYSVSKAGYVTINEPLPSYPAKDQTKDIFVTLVKATDDSWTRPPYPEVTKIQPGYPDTNWTRPPYPEVTKIQPGYPDTNWTRPPYPEVTKIQPGYPDTNWTRPSYLDWLWNRPSIKNFLKDIFG